MGPDPSPSASEVIDAHHHVWNLDRIDYPWLTADLAPIDRTIEETELEPELARTGIDRTVVVQAANDAAETAYLFEVADRWPRIAGIVGWVPLDRPDDAAVALDRYADDPRFVGVRHLIHDEPDPDWVVRDEVVAGLELLAERDLTFDVVAVTPRHLRHVGTLSRTLPTLRLVIDHLGKPDIARREWEPWATSLAAVAEAPNVYAKVSGLTTVSPAGWTGADLRPYVEHARAVFGSERLMFGSDWPMSLLAGTYDGDWSEIGAVLTEWPPAERSAVLGETAVRCYRLPPPSPTVPGGVSRGDAA